MALDPEVKAKWIADLRSGQYRQVDGHLHYHGAFCCLGVLCVSVGAKFEDFTDTTEWGPATYEDVPVLNGETLAYRDHQELAPAFMGRIGMASDDQNSLVAMNDAGVSFTQIADYIEKNL